MDPKRDQELIGRVNCSKNSHPCKTRRVAYIFAKNVTANNKHFNGSAYMMGEYKLMTHQVMLPIPVTFPDGTVEEHMTTFMSTQAVVDYSEKVVDETMTPKTVKGDYYQNLMGRRGGEFKLILYRGEMEFC